MAQAVRKRRRLDRDFDPREARAYRDTTQKPPDLRLWAENLATFKADLPLYASNCLTILNKDGELVKLEFNSQQVYLHAKMERQLAQTGMVRMIIGKGRQTTISTYIGARFYHKTSLNYGTRTFILTHDQRGTDNLFEMVERFHLNTPLKPSTGASNAKELYFDKLDSGYSVGVAATKATGRSQTIRLLHWSEVAHSANARGHKAGVVQTVPYSVGTEIVLESTGNGPVDVFYEDWQQAEAGVGDYRCVFIPWFWAAEYTRAVDRGFVLDEEEARYCQLHNLTLGQMAWRRAKLLELKDPILFMMEYPATAVEMFRSTGQQSYINPELVLEARKRTCEGIGPLICGVDPARFGDDRFSVAWRRGRKVPKVESRLKIGTVEALAWLRDIIDRDKPVKMFIDAGGGGDRLYDILKSWGKPYSDVIVLVNFGGKPWTEIRVERDGTHHPGPVNRRAEMWMNSLDWLEQEGGTDIPDLDSIQMDACAPRRKYRVADQRLQIESKEELRSRGVRSPDEWDAIVLTLAEPVIERPADMVRIGRTMEVGAMQETSMGPSTAWLGV